MSYIVEKEIGNFGVEIVMKNDGQPLGNVIVHLDKKTSKIGFINVKPNCRSQNYATDLVNAAVDWSRRKNATQIVTQLIPSPGSEKAALRVLEKTGFNIDLKRGKAIKHLEITP